FLGRARQGFERGERDGNRRRLGHIFNRVDINKDKKISAKEMQRWIMEKTDEHFQEAVEENKIHFKAVDPDGDGHVSWDEYKIKFLASKGFNEKEIAEKIKNNEELKIDEESKCRLLLSEQEFLSFLHPEHSRGMLHFMVQEIIRDLGNPAFYGICAHEFLVLCGFIGRVCTAMAAALHGAGDHPGPGQEYMDPMNEHNALNEARQMIAVADENQNHQLELDEILKYSEYFTGSKLMDYARNVHEEF
ncbi:PREDICTED: 45 kDa calcium-binding protein-like, partial [Sturnus vulgaris]|uniref:45 kDa calcium-binding protein-like n=1 Tax=Sturnus vulgaris TaxID=9172 RepID=UPI00071A1195